ncbi:hypothetical protein [Nitrospirillum iridis]|uniref:DNA-binding IclR family transcriptional regulator n=1 Tax=Nitrospirillum iridis TaxID=765888 RepID=A0A7X0B0Z8_9PROT|nr:hypothetical protein [Nitrospirillum iridis]MBB6253352.1 DNA-binding IclR family transcriptional regulator [Nitrospirillum iridis]
MSQRAAMLGSGFQPAIVRDGRLTHLIDQLVVQTGLTVATFGIVGIRSQIFSWRSRTGNPSSGALSNLYGGVQERLTGSAAGWLLLSTIAQPRRDGLIRRLLADQEGENKPTFADMASRVSACQARGYAHGPVGCGSTAEVMALLLPGQPERHPLAIGFVYEPSLQIDQAALLQCLQEAVEPYIQAGDSRPIPFPHPTRPTYSEPELKAV